MSEYIIYILQYLGIESSNYRVLHWIILLVGVIVVYYCANLFGKKVFIPLIRTFTKKTQNLWDDILLNNNVLKDFVSLIAPIVIAILLPFVIAENSILYIYCMKICWIYIIIVATKLVCSVLNSLYILSNNLERTKNTTLQGVFQMLKIATICISIIIVVSTLIDRDPIKILAGLGASAAVLMLIFKDSIMGLVAGVQLSANDMLRPGDWISMPKHGADGSVIDVSLTTVKVQNWDKTITTIPPYLLVSDSFQNWRGMQDSGGRRIKRSIYIDMNSITFCSNDDIKKFAEKGWIENNENSTELVNLGVFRNYLENYLRKSPLVNPDMVIMVRQLQPTPQGVPLELYFFYNGITWVAYEHAQSEIFEHVFAILPEFGLKAFQSPSGKDLSLLRE
ncbi:MAG: mechanosensitive ion channel [Bacteroidaceae bacterium]|nr:mechanosensitive ion channel [Bacteroidaceae bacterium]